MIIATKYFDHAQEAQVTFSRARSFFTCDINLHAGRGLRLRGEGEAAGCQHRVRRRGRAYCQAAAPLSPPGATSMRATLANRERPEAARQFVLERTGPTGESDERTALAVHAR